LSNTTKSALYVDFNNIFLSLQRKNPAAAVAFAEHPEIWLSWFEQGRHRVSVDAEPASASRRVLVRRCYLNPDRFSRYRWNFVRAGFSVIDCPALTVKGKNSADIYMVIDIIDALDHRTCFDEFIILSSDADFTPVLSRVRERDRSSTIIANTVAVAALRAASDCTLTETAFIRDALGIATGVEPLERIAGKTREALVGTATGTLLLSSLGGKLGELREELLESRYNGHGSLMALLKSGEIPGRYRVSEGGDRALIFDPERWRGPGMLGEVEHTSETPEPDAIFQEAAE